MAQALPLANTMLGQPGQSIAQCAVLVISGQVFFKYRTANDPRLLNDKHVQTYMALAMEMKLKELVAWKDWASSDASYWNLNKCHRCQRPLAYLVV
jgi:hypothetical protein